MRRIATFSLPLLFLLASTAPSSAQLVTIGIKGGATFSDVSITGATVPKTGNRTGKVVGGSVEFGLGGLGIRPEVLFVQKGYEVSASNSNATFYVDYIEIPLLLVARLGTGSIRPALYGGPALAFESACSISGSFPNFDAEGDCDAPDIDVQRDTNDWGAAFGAELGISLGGLVLVVDGRYTLGLKNLDKSEGLEERKNRVFSLMAGIQIPIG